MTILCGGATAVRFARAVTQTTQRAIGWSVPSGFGHVQIAIAARELLSGHSLLEAHAAALRDSMRLTGIGLVLHAPGDLLAGSRRDDAQLEGALRYAELARADLLVLHAGRSATSPPPDRPRLDAEERSLRGLAHCAADRGVRLAIENSAPCYAGHECLSHDPAVVAALVRRLGCAEVGMCLDIGHAHIAADRAGRDLAELIEPLLDVVILFGIHDNFGARSGAQRAGGIEAMRLDLHLARADRPGRAAGARCASSHRRAGGHGCA